MPILNYTTTVSALRTASQVQDMLAKHGASEVSLRYANGAPVALSFTIGTSHGARDFRLPVNVEGVYDVIKKHGSGVPPRYQSRAQAEKIAWRITKDWVEAQLAMIEAGLSRLDEVMLPFMMVGEYGQTLSERYQVSAGMRAAIESSEVRNASDV